MKLSQVDRWTYDIEVFSHNWLFVAKHRYEDLWYVVWDDYSRVEAFFDESPIIGGFNTKAYDQFIARAILAGWTHEEIKRLSDRLVMDDDFSGWSINWREYKLPFVYNYDIRDDLYEGLSLKAIEAHLGMDICETEVSFSLDRPLNHAEKKATVKYCKADVLATEKLESLREGYLQTKLNLGEVKGLSPAKSLSLTNAGLTAIFLDADKSRVPYSDEREYKYPDKLLIEYIPEEVINFFNQLYDKSISRYDLFSRKLELTIGHCKVTLAWGGIHGAIPHYREVATDTRKIRNKDVESYYPHLMVLALSHGQKYGFTSRAIPDPAIFANTLKERIAAKKSGDKVKNQSLKLVLNTTYGCMGSGGTKLENGKEVYYSRNDLYDGLMSRSVCITGQLFLLELTYHVMQECKSAELIQLNTDGIMVSLDDSDEAKWQEITEEWQQRTGFRLEEDFIQSITQRDVNNYVEVAVDGGMKVKGGDLVRGISEAGAWKVNNNATVVAKAIAEYFAHGVTIRDTIMADDDVSHYQIIAKAGSSYTATYQKVGSEYVPVQRVNRVYASKGFENGTLYKQKTPGSTLEKIASLPTFCLVDNRGTETTIEQIDKAWYIKLAEDKARKFVSETRKSSSRKTKAIWKNLIKELSA